MPEDALGRLEKIDLREIWRSESQDFTPWLARAKNLELLGDALGIDLELEAQERNVGPFKADLLCKDLSDEFWVLIENQLERTDHIHLGQLLTYAAGLQTVTIVWISSKFTDEHRAALDWLNEVTSDKFRFFGLEVELWKIGESPAAPKFNVVSQPNEWAKSVEEGARRIEAQPLSETKSQQLKFWEGLRSDVAEKTGLRSQKPLPQHWLSFSMGKSGVHLSALLNTKEDRLGVELVITAESAKSYFQKLLQERAAIEKELGFQLEWRELPNKRSSKIACLKSDCDLNDERRWPEYTEWFVEHLAKMNSTFRKRTQLLNDEDVIENIP